jgi:hypothetical protein
VFEAVRSVAAMGRSAVLAATAGAVDPLAAPPTPLACVRAGRRAAGAIVSGSGPARCVSVRLRAGREGRVGEPVGAAGGRGRLPFMMMDGR